MTPLSYVTLFSSAGVGCYGFLQERFHCVATNELIARRMDVQIANHKCDKLSGYIIGDITDECIQSLIYGEVNNWEKENCCKDIDVVIATPPCQGMSVANHKKKEDEIKRNSLVTESIKIIKKIKPKFFIFENVPAFLHTICTDIDNVNKTIQEAIDYSLASEYSIYGKVINFKDYGACSSRSRTLVIGVRNDFSDDISPIELFPDIVPEKTLRQVIGKLPSLNEWGKISDNDIYHSFRTYPEYMRSWISCLKEGESSFDNKDPLLRPHQIIDGEIKPNIQKNGDKYKRQYWDKIGPCIHTRNDQLASQNTIHPSDDRVFSIRELMLMMTIPFSFRWTVDDTERLNAMAYDEKVFFLKKNSTNIRQSIGEAVPTVIFQSIAKKIKSFSEQKILKTRDIQEYVLRYNLFENNNLKDFIIKNTENYTYSSLCRIAEYVNKNKEENAAFFTNKSLITEVVKSLPDFDGKECKILEPSVGIGNFLPLLFKKYEKAQHVDLVVCDIDMNVLSVLQVLLAKKSIPKNFSISFINDDFILHSFSNHFDLVVGNPPFSKLNGSNDKLHLYRKNAKNKITTNTFCFFLEKSLSIGNYVALITPKNLLNTPEFQDTRTFLNSMEIDFILDFGEKGFHGVLVETICIGINTCGNPGITRVKSFTGNLELIQKQSYITDGKFPYWIIYRNNLFDNVADKMIFDIFSVFRDRQITNTLLSKSGDIPVIKSRNIADDGKKIVHIPKYDSYISLSSAKKLSVFSYYERNDVYLTPNMTYNPRVICKPMKTLVNGSTAILILKTGQERLSEEQMAYFSTKEYRTFYRIARNFQTRSLNVDASSVFFFGKKKQ